MDPIDSNEQSTVHLANYIGQQGKDSQAKVGSQLVYDRKQAMKNLAEMTMPVDTHAMMVNVDDVIAGAMQTINDSLKLSSQHIDLARQRLMQAHPALKQAYDPEVPSPLSATSETQDTSSTSTAMDEFNQHLLNELDKDTKDYQKQVLATHDTQQQQAMAKQEEINSVAENMQQELLAQQQAYQQHIMAQVSHSSVPVVAPKADQEQSQHGQMTTPQAEEQTETPSSESAQAASSSLKPADEEK
ncbi:hypothetical protein Sden_3144 [Shewanella denitrificans OS217]|uniref:Uncharacterized protein n=1 Tax=Shewanella denitrificans (strain OS217 / ATCC BAA-1090 / DSM 15013) TaxID=318161 RepID=Q12JF6_SHEDO|nr:hypothetical protein [Shewanella denitrificans]ABE56420.1 hypothetical protein Sden_3144 [Shewanella denitrificans OS217]